MKIYAVILEDVREDFFHLIAEFETKDEAKEYINSLKNPIGYRISYRNKRVKTLEEKLETLIEELKVSAFNSRYWNGYETGTIGAKEARGMDIARERLERLLSEHKKES